MAIGLGLAYMKMVARIHFYSSTASVVFASILMKPESSCLQIMAWKLFKAWLLTVWWYVPSQNGLSFWCPSLPFPSPPGPGHHLVLLTGVNAVGLAFPVHLVILSYLPLGSWDASAQNVFDSHTACSMCDVWAWHSRCSILRSQGVSAASSIHVPTCSHFCYLLFLGIVHAFIMWLLLIHYPHTPAPAALSCIKTSQFPSRLSQGIYLYPSALRYFVPALCNSWHTLPYVVVCVCNSSDDQLPCSKRCRLSCPFSH